MENIAPLAKVLAEANGLDWQQIKGTGAGHQITEDDVLGHLALIMSGEIEPPSTPVDPEPSPAELAAAASPELLSRAGVDSDLTDLLKMQEDARAAMKAEAAASAAASAPTADDFELDDEPAAPAAHSTHEEAPLVSEPAAAMGAGAVMGGLLSSMYSKPAESAAPQTPEPAAHQETAHQETVTPAFSMPGISAEPTPAYNAPAYSTPAHTETPHSETLHTEPVHTEPTYQEPVYHEPVYHEPAQPAYAASYSEPQHEESVQVPPVSAWSQPAPAPVAPAYEQSSHQQPAYQAAPTASYSAYTDAQPSHSAPASSDWKGVYLRRDADVAQAEEARQQLTEMLGTFPLSVLVARAAQKSAASLGLSSVALANTSGEALSASLVGDLRASLSGMQDLAGTQADLLVVDAGELGLDDLHYPHATTLSVGRVEGGKAALSLNGQVDPAQGAQFLVDVAALLSTPVKLLV